MVYQERRIVAVADTIATGGQTQLNNFSCQEMTTARLTCLVVAFLLLGQLDTSDAACKYRVKVKTGGQNSASTNANVRIKLYGSVGTSGWRTLDTSGFPSGSTKNFLITCPCVGCVNEFGIRHDNTGQGPAWYLQSVGVKLKNVKKYKTFPCKQWIWTQERVFKSSPTKYKIKVITGSAGTNDVNLKICTSKSCSQSTKLVGPFGPKSTKYFYWTINDVCPLKKIKLHIAPTSPWTIVRVYVTNQESKSRYLCSCGKKNCAVSWMKTVNCYPDIPI